MSYTVEYSQTSREQIRTLHPSLKSVIRARVEDLKINPYLGKALERDLSGYHSYRAKRFRIIYKINDAALTIQIYYIGHRTDVYELLSKLITRGPK